MLSSTALELLEDVAGCCVNALCRTADRLVGVVAAAAPGRDVAEAISRAVESELVTNDERHALGLQLSQGACRADAVDLAVEDRVRQLVSERLDGLCRLQPVPNPDALHPEGPITLSFPGQLGDLAGVSHSRTHLPHPRKSPAALVADPPPAHPADT